MRVNKDRKGKAAGGQNQLAEFERAVEKSNEAHYRLRLFVSGTTPRSMRAIRNIKAICEEHLKGRYLLEVVDIFQQPELAKSEDIIAAPTLIKRLPLPLRKWIGDLASKERIVVGLDLYPKG